MEGKPVTFFRPAANRFGAPTPLIKAKQQERRMFYRKNLFAWEQMIRVIMGVAMAGYGLFGLPGGWLGYGLAAMGAFLAVTGVFGYCPACAMIGRKPVGKP
jgi:hypothetical protein